MYPSGLGLAQGLGLDLVSDALLSEVSMILSGILSMILSIIHSGARQVSMEVLEGLEDSEDLADLIIMCS